MAQLSPLIQFTAGTPAVAADVNSNFADIRNHINSASIDTENIAPTLTSRAGGPILFLNQSSQNEIVFSIQNSQPNTGMYILQSTALADATKAVVKIEDSITQLAASNNGKAELWLSLAGGSTIPALLVEHGANTSMSLTKTQLNLFNSAIQATSTGVLTATTTNVTTVNATDINTTGKITVTAPVSDAIALKVKGRSSDNNAIVQFKSNDDATVYASATSSSSGLSLNLPDTADNYTFQINGVTKGVINNSGVDATYIYNLPVPQATRNTFNWGAGTIFTPAGGYANATLINTTFVTSLSNRVVMVRLNYSGYGVYNVYVNGQHVVKSGEYGAGLGPYDNIFKPYFLTASGTYSVQVDITVYNGTGLPANVPYSAGSIEVMVI